MQLQQLLQPLQEGTFRFARTFLNDNPDLLQKYVSTGMNVVGTVLVPLNLFMKHLLVIQKLDPNTVPGQKAAKELQAAMDLAFKNDHEAEYDEDFDLDWINKRFEQARKQLRELQLTKEKFMDLTDLAKIPMGPQSGNKFTLPGVIDRGYDDEEFFDRTTEVNRVAPVSHKRELPLDKEGRAALREKVLRDAAFNLKNEAIKTAQKVTATVGFDPITDLRNAVKAIEKDLGLDTKKPTKLGGLKTSKKKVNKKIARASFKEPLTRMTVKSKATDSKFKGNFRRVIDPRTV